LTDQTTTRRFSAAMAPHLDAAYNLARWLTRDPHDAEDVLQEACLRALRFFEGFRGGDGRAWLLKIVRNTAYTWMQQNRRPEANVQYDETREAEAQAQGGGNLHDEDPQGLLLREADRQQVEKALLQLPTDFREILVLRELEELSYREIAEVAGIPLGTVMSRLSRAREHLRRALIAAEGSA